MTEKFSDKRVVLITDASTPKARALSKRLREDGYIVVNNYPRKKIQDESAHYSYFYETHSYEAMEELLEKIIEDAGDLFALIHTDNEIIASTIEDISEEDFKRALDLNTKSAFMSTKVFGEYMAGKGRGSLVYLSSLHDEKPTGSAFTYSVGKGAVKMLSKEMALFYGRQGLRSNLIEADYVEEERELLDSLTSPFNYDAETKIPLRRLARPEDFAGIVSFLISDDSAFINGAEIRIDGGHVLYYGDRRDSFGSKS